MKKLRLVLIVLAVPAGILLGLHEIGGTPISKGYDTGFGWRQEGHGKRLVLSSDADGNITCFIKMEISGTSSRFSAQTSNQTRLKITQSNSAPGYQILTISKDSAIPEDKFEWPSGSVIDLDVEPQGASSGLTVVDWYVYTTAKSYDSYSRARWRKLLFHIALGLLLISLMGVTLEAISRFEEKQQPFSPERCIQLLIGAVEGSDDKETGRMRTSLAKVLFQGSTVRDALAPFKLGKTQENIFWIKTAGRFRTKLRFLISELDNYLKRL